MMRKIIPHSPSMKHPVSRLAHPHALIALLLLFVASAGCVYRMPIQQGNFLDQKAIDQLQVGMTRSQVRFLLGTPMVPDAFDRDRWDYLYYLEVRRLGAPERRLLTVHFEEDKVARVEKHNIPDSAAASAPAAAQVAPPAPPGS
jgi:outer membrane protein assembly factor BamE